MTDPALITALESANEIDIVVIGRKSKRPIRLTVWFVLAAERLNLLPVSGSDTQWFKNVVSQPAIEIRVGRRRITAHAEIIEAPRKVNEITDLFRAKYGVGDVKRYYPKIDVAVTVDLSRARRAAAG